MSSRIAITVGDVTGVGPEVTLKALAAEWDAWAKRAHVDSWDGPRRLPWGDDAPPEKAAAR